MNFNSLNKLFVISISIIITLILFIFSIGAYIVLPQYSSLLDKFITDLPLITKIIFYSYKFWVLIPIASLFISIKITNIKADEIINQYIMLLVPIFLFVLSIGIFIVTFYSIYLPILEFEKNGQ